LKRVAAAGLQWSLLALLTDARRRDLAEVSEDRCAWTSTLFASQRSPTAWHAAIGEPSAADAICDLLIHQAHRLTLSRQLARLEGSCCSRSRIRAFFEAAGDSKSRGATSR